MSSFVFWYLASLLLLVAFAGWIGRSAEIPSLGRKTWLGILIDSRERFSLNRLQLLMWTLLVLATLLALFVPSILHGSGASSALAIPQHLLILIGISAGSATIAGAIKDGKNNDPKVAGQIARGGLPHPAARSVAPAGPASAARMAILKASGNVKPHWRQMFLEEEGTNSEVIVNVSKYQNFIFTIILGIVYLTLTIKTTGYPDFDEKILWLLGISHGSYVGGKIPDKG